MKDIFKHIGKTFGTWTDNALNELSLNDFINMPLRDFVDGVNPNNYLQNQNKTSIFGSNNEVRLFTDRISIDNLSELADDSNIPLDMGLPYYASVAELANDAVNTAMEQGWSRDALQRVEQLTEEIENGRFVFKRFLVEESRVCKETLGQSTWLVSGRSESPVQEAEGVDQKGNGETQQERTLVNLAIARNLSSKEPSL